ncbi:MAG TPA: hypothetical protein VK742_08720 [Candidatus Sulfotelmatobacter sp.]|nr:hypothetical protein [Candidatus Sulfotelmatobacter sp.]
MNFEYRHTNIKHRASGEAFLHTSYCRSDEEALSLARLTFHAAVWEIGGDDPVPEPDPTVPPMPVSVSNQYSLNLC